MQKIAELFEVRYGLNLELNALKLDPNGINFVSRTSKNNGVSARVQRILGLEPTEAGVLTVAAGGSVLETFLQPEPFYSGRDLYYLRPKVPMTELQKLFYCLAIRANRYRYNYGRQANRTLGGIALPSLEEIPPWVYSAPLPDVRHMREPAKPGGVPLLDTTNWQWFQLSDLFEIKKGKRLTKQDMIPGTTLFIGSSDANNGLTALIGQEPIHEGNTISVCYNGSVAEAFYQPRPFWATDDVNVLYPKFPLNPYRAMFLVTIIRREKYRFNYGRKWHLGRMEQSSIKLPALPSGKPDWDYMERFIQALPFSSQIEQAVLSPQTSLSHSRVTYGEG